MSKNLTMSIAVLGSPAEIVEEQIYTGMRLSVDAVGASPLIWEDVQGKFVRREAPGYDGKVVPAIFLDRRFRTGQVVQVGMNSRGRTVRVEIDGAFHALGDLLPCEADV